MNRKKESLVAEMAEMRRKIAIQELRQAGQPIPAVRAPLPPPILR